MSTSKKVSKPNLGHVFTGRFVVMDIKEGVYYGSAERFDEFKKAVETRKFIVIEDIHLATHQIAKFWLEQRPFTERELQENLLNNPKQND